eukprot:TRINITY_DN14332_c0_g1_i1.p1 TRINITY_DN14332_c0_g1~~TRINITY_DN14332_c0_g1_i1.p1  ORF type:complete len:400 (+),score=65.71 TRINITY_DN14332_c0_g1_i1:113-1312(+)
MLISLLSKPLWWVDIFILEFIYTFLYSTQSKAIMTHQDFENVDHNNSSSSQNQLLTPTELQQDHVKDRAIHVGILSCSILVWYFGSISTNIANKAFLDKANLPLTLPLTQFFGSAIIGLIVTNIGSRYIPMHTYKTHTEWIKVFIPLGIGYGLSNILSQFSLKRIPVSFTHTVKSTAPIFTIFLAKVFLKETYSWDTYLTLIPIISGVGLASASEPHFDVDGFFAALLSTFVLCVQQIASKHVFRSTSIHPLALHTQMSIAALLCLIPLWVMWELPIAAEILLPHANASQASKDKLTSIASSSSDWISLWMLLLINALAYYTQNALAFVVMSWVSPLTYSVAGTLKRVFVILSSVLYFGNQVSLINGLGIGMSIYGAFSYNQHHKVKKQKGKSKPHSDV